MKDWDAPPRAHVKNIDAAVYERGVITVEASLDNGEVGFAEVDMRKFGELIERALVLADRLRPELITVLGTPGDGSRHRAVVPFDDVDVQVAAGGVRLVVRCGIVDLSIQFPAERAMRFAEDFHRKAQKQSSAARKAASRD